MSLPRKYARRIRRVLGLRAVWQPGAVVELGDIVTLRRGIFVPVESLSMQERVRLVERVLALAHVNPVEQEEAHADAASPPPEREVGATSARANGGRR